MEPASKADKPGFAEYDYSNFYYGAGDDPLDLLTPFARWYREARPNGYYLYQEALGDYLATMELDPRGEVGAQALLAWRLVEREEAAPRTDDSGKLPHASAWRERTPRARAAVTVFLLLPSIVFSNIVFFNLFGDFFRYGFYGFLFWADLLLLIASYVVLLPPALAASRTALLQR